MTAQEFIEQLRKLSTNEQRAKYLEQFNLTKENEVLGIPMGKIFALAKENVAIPNDEILRLLASNFHEARVGAVSIMDFQARNKKTSDEQRKWLYDTYLRHHDLINNWDLVDRAAPYVVGGYLFDKSREPLYKLAKSKNIWERRTAIVVTYFFIKNGDVDDTFKIAEILVDDPEDLIHKAVGGWLREAGKKDPQRLINFLDIYAAKMPRVMLRYAVEKLDPEQKRKYMKG